MKISARGTIILVAVFIALALTVAVAGPARSAGEPFAVIEGKAITVDEVDRTPDLAARIYEAKRQLHQLRVAAVSQEIGRRVLEKEAAERKTTSEKLLEEAMGVEPAVTKEEVDHLISERVPKASLPKNDEEWKKLRESAEGFLKRQKTEKKMADYLATLQAKYNVKIVAEAPARPRVDLPKTASDAPALGPDGAPVTIVEFSDFQCPYCARVSSDLLPQIRKTYGDKVRFVFRDFPLDSHKEAVPAAVAARCAGRQGKFWEMHDALFAGQKELGGPLYEKVGKEIGLDAAKFSECRKDRKVAEAAISDLRDGTKAGVNSTPTFFVNGLPVEGAISFDEFRKVIDAEIAATAKK
ncbi:MAG: thioredoxin domain-containing protein [Nitrospirae bacterium]|nr:thioredoxin domain-containing protein [Nitrospirota bacterium]